MGLRLGTVARRLTKKHLTKGAFDVTDLGISYHSRYKKSRIFVAFLYDFNTKIAQIPLFFNGY